MMMDRPSESLKRTCLICGCHTNQTINIYEPRSGPNIVKLIQAKFKFQPLNEDKYLCFSCNNWLINWHSLQALNSNDAESPSGTFRAPHLNGVRNEKDSSSQQRHVKPVAEVRPRQLLELECIEVELSAENKNIKNSPKPMDSKVQGPQQGGYSKCITRMKTHRCLRCEKRCNCCTRIVRTRNSTRRNRTTTFRITKAASKTLKYRKNCELSTMFKNNSPRECNIVNKLNTNKKLMPTVVSAEIADQKHLPLHRRPTVDGKVVAMLRRVGTTLSRVAINEAGNDIVSAALPPTIMSPAKKKPHWTRPLDDDEILLDFNTAISEVLDTSNSCRRRLEYHISGGEANAENIPVF